MEIYCVLENSFLSYWSWLIFLKVFTNFAAVYQNYTTMYELNVCINYTINTFSNLQIIKTMFDGVTCSGFNSSNMISKLLYISDTLKFCLNGTEVHNVKTPGPGKNEQFCGKQYFLFPSLYLFISHSSCIFTSCINI